MLTAFVEQIAHAAREAAEPKLESIQLPEADAQRIAAIVDEKRSGGIAALSGKDQDAWGALTIFAHAHASNSQGAGPPPPYSPTEIDALARGKRLWLRLGFQGIEHQHKRLLWAAKPSESDDSAEVPTPSRDPKGGRAKVRRSGLKLEASPLPTRDGEHRVSVRAFGARQSEPLRCALMADDDGATATLISIDGDKVTSNDLALAVNAPSCELRFTVHSAVTNNVRVRLQVAADEAVARTLRLPGAFAVNAG